MSRLVITNCHLIDALSDHAQPDASVAIEDGLITRIETNNTKIDPDGATGHRCPRWLASPGPLGRTRAPHVSGSPTQDHPPPRRQIWQECYGGPHRKRSNRHPQRRNRKLDRRGLAGRLRLWTVPWPSHLRFRLFPHYHRRTCYPLALLSAV